LVEVREEEGLGTALAIPRVRTAHPSETHFSLV